MRNTDCITTGRQYTRFEAVDKMLDSYEAYYNVHRTDADCTSNPRELVARCEFYQKTVGSALVKNDVSWQYTSEEFLYLYNVEHLTVEKVNELISFAREDAYPKMNIGPRHMYSYITPVIICDSADPEALRGLKRCKINKSFRFSLHGWMEVHTAVLEVNNHTITTNRSGKSVGKVLKNVLYYTKRRRFLK